MEHHSDVVNRQEKQKFYFDRKARWNLSPFPAGDPVMMKFGDTWKRAEVVTSHTTPRSYEVRDKRRLYRRNSNVLRPTQVASKDVDLPKTVPSQSEAESVINQANGQT